MHDSHPVFDSSASAASRPVSWIHLGDTHLTQPGEENAIDLGRIVDEINALYAGRGIDFVFVPGDIADDGSSHAYEVFRSHLDRLKIPWFGIVGDHDVHEKSFTNFQRYVASDLYSEFALCGYRFFRLNAFSVPRPDSFDVNEEQLRWLEDGLKACREANEKAVLFLHCYPSDLKQGGSALSNLLTTYPVLLVDMGHTHYNEISNDGDVLYTATRSTGQIEEGKVGYSVTTIDQDVVSWHFVELGEGALVNVTHPADARMRTRRNASRNGSSVDVHAKVWPTETALEVTATLDGSVYPLLLESGLWSTALPLTDLPEGMHEIEVRASFSSREPASTVIRLATGDTGEDERAERDQDNAIGAWPERGLLGTQLGPNKNGRKW